MTGGVGRNMLDQTPKRHGLAVAGAATAIGSNNFGISGVIGNNHNIKFLPVAGWGSYESILRAFEYIYQMRLLYNITNGESGAYIVAVNLSFTMGGDASFLSNMRLKISDLGRMGVLSITGAGNWNRLVSDVNLPQAIVSPYLIIVGGTTHIDQKWIDSCYGQTRVHIGAPSYNILTAGWYVAHYQNIYIPNSFISLSGTSLAAPQVAGVIGLMYAAANEQLLTDHDFMNNSSGPSNLALQMRKHLLYGADRVPALVSYFQNGRRLNAYGAVMNVVYPENYITGTRTISQNTQLTGRYIIDGGTLILNSITLTNNSSNSRFYGFEIINGGRLEIRNSNVSLGDGFIRCVGANSTVFIESTLFGGRLSLGRGRIEILDGAKMTVRCAVLDIINSTVTVDGNGSELTLIPGGSLNLMSSFHTMGSTISVINGAFMNVTQSIMNIQNGALNVQGTGSRLNIASESIVTATENTIQISNFATKSLQNSTVNITGSDGKLLLFPTSVLNSSQGNLYVSNGASMSVTGASMNIQNGALNVQGTGSRLNIATE
jgi:hypothetical protein